MEIKRIEIGPVFRDSEKNVYGLDWRASDLSGVVVANDLEIAVPAGCVRLQLWPRLAGDIYAELQHQGGAVSGVGQDAAAAIGAAVAKMRAAA